MRHMAWHLIGCLLPIAVIFLLPLFGVSSGVTLFAFIVLMFGCHLFMVRGHGGGDEDVGAREEDHGGQH